MAIAIEQIADHLEFYGYKIEKREMGEGRAALFLATHDERPNMRFHEISPYCIFFSAGFRSQSAPSPAICEFMNRLNEKLVITRAYFAPQDPGPGLIVKLEAVYMGIYKKDLFAAFYEMLRTDTASMHKLEDCDRLFVAEAA